MRFLSRLASSPRLQVALIACALVAFGVATAGATEVTFRFQPPAGSRTVTVAGTMNGWDTGAAPLVDEDSDGVWETTLDLAPGSYQYKFVVNGTQWITDESAASFADDGYGGKNSVVEVADKPLVVGMKGQAAKAPAAAPPAAPVASATSGVTFSYRPAGKPGSLSVAGTFNNWTIGANPMSDADGDGTWTAVIPLAPGEYQYKFVADGNWITDESAASFVDDGFGGKNSVVTVGANGAAATTTPAPAAPAAPAAGTKVTFRYQPVIGGVNSVSVAGSMNGWDPNAAPLKDDDQDGVWETTLTLAPGEYQYKFVVNGDQWFADDFAAETAPDGFGGENSLIRVGTKALVTGPGGNVEKAAAEDSGGLRQVLFRYRPTGKPGEVALAGSFNDWTVGKTLMTDPDGDGEYTVTLLLAPAEYQYKFVVDGNWTTDREHADAFTDDGFGGQNSVVRVDDRFPAVELGLGDGRVFEAGIAHGQTAKDLNNQGGGRIEVTFPAHRGDVESVTLHVLEDGTAVRTVPMPTADQDGVFEYHRATVTVAAGHGFRYAAEYRDGAVSRFLSAKGWSDALPPSEDWFAFTEAAFPPFATPDWVKDAVIYQIFPDRFQNGDPANDQTFTEWYYDGKRELPASGKTNEEYYHLVTDWYDVSGLTASPYRTDGKPDWFSFYGGDIAGVRKGLDYLQDLGVTAIYFNPLFEAKSNHKYDCATYLQIDPHFGTNDEFKAFVADAHARGIRIVLDIVFNHTGNCHYAFQDAVKHGPESPYYDWYEFKRWPLPASGPFKASDYYQCWWDFGDLPDLNFDLSRANPSENGVQNISEAQPNRALLDHLMDVVDFWIGEMDCDGVRLDVANEVPFWFWKEFNKRVKANKADAYIVGEIWGNASAWIGPNLFDATMNYAFFRDPVTKFLGQGQGTAAEFDRTLATGRSAYPTQSVQVMMNLVGSHDTVRFLTQVGNDPNRVKLASMFAFTYVGAPHVYYGDEIGMTGGKDPDCRRPFLWNWAENPQRTDMHDHFRRLGAIRKEHAALRRGSFTTLLAQGQVFAFERRLDADRVVVALNAGRSPAEVSVPLAGGAQGTDLMTGEAVDLTKPLALGAETGRVIALR